MPSAKLPKRSRARVGVKKNQIQSQKVTTQTADTLERLFAVASVMVLGATSLIWAILGARIHQDNADQLINAYLFENWDTFQGSMLPGAHTFLVKWPLFWLLKTTGPTEVSMTLATVFVSLVTVAALVYLLCRIERRPMLLGIYTLALASVLLLVPPQPVAGTLLPVNMAMIATRNIEYVLYIFILVLCIRAPKTVRSKQLWLAVFGMSLLMASDNLFLTLSFGGSFLATLFYAVVRHRTLFRLSVVWFGVSIVAALGSAGLLWLMNTSGFVHIATAAFGSPYGLAQSFKEVANGLVFGALGLLTNFGANPIFDISTIKAMPSILGSRLLSPFVVPFLVNFGVLCIGIYAALRIWWAAARRSKGTHQARTDTATSLAHMLIWSTIAACGAFVVTKHYYAVDARYLTIALFTIFVAAAVVWRSRKLPNLTTLAFVIGVLLCSIGIGIASAAHVYSLDRTALKVAHDRNRLVAQVLKNHPVQSLVGDYWRVTPIKSMTPSVSAIVPLEACTNPRNVLSSHRWQREYMTHSFAYLLSLDQKSADFPSCTFDQVIAEYGKPNASFLVNGTLDAPKELLLFYDEGARNGAPITPADAPHSTILPLALDQLPQTACPEGAPTTVNIVAHQDDDLLFLNPDLLHDIKAGRCIRSIYVTAGDAGGGKLYWLARERGSQAAYNSMLGQSQGAIWAQHVVKLSDHHFATIASPRDNPRISLIFLHLPDGNLTGQGFKASRNQSLERLGSGMIDTIDSVDGQSSYTSEQLVNALAQLLNAYRPTEIRTQAAQNEGQEFNDHSDHIAVGQFTDRAVALYTDRATTNTWHYVGYPIRERPENVVGDDLYMKMLAFTIYGTYDSGVCHTFEQCNRIPTYGSYLRRQYTIIR